MKGLLIIFGGLPGTGKTSIAKELCRRISSTYLRIDTIEQVLLSEGCLKTGTEGYSVAYAIAVDNLRASKIVVSDSVNPIKVTRDAWRKVALENKSHFFEVEIICSDTKEHRRRVVERKADIIGHVMPTWEDVASLQYEPWETKNFTIDTSKSSCTEATELIFEELKRLEFI